MSHKKKQITVSVQHFLKNTFEVNKLSQMGIQLIKFSFLISEICYPNETQYLMSRTGTQGDIKIILIKYNTLLQIQ